LFANSDAPPNDTVRAEIKRVMEKRVDDLMRRELETHVVTVPILGVSIDGNDLWMVSSFVIIALLIILRASLNRELDNLRRASVRATSHVKRELLIMAQLFASPQHRLVHIVLFLPIALYAFDLYNTLLTAYVSDALNGSRLEKLLTTIQCAMIIPVVYLCIRCFLEAYNIARLVVNLEKHPADIKQDSLNRLTPLTAVADGITSFAVPFGAAVLAAGLVGWSLSVARPRRSGGRST
jgi:hypothetical protein